jgi:hypothetical protein
MVVSVSFNKGVPVTVTVEVTWPGSSRALTVVVVPPRTRISVNSSALKPSFVMVTGILLREHRDCGQQQVEKRNKKSR